jgi:hypothetical protein
MVAATSPWPWSTLVPLRGTQRRFVRGADGRFPVLFHENSLTLWACAMFRLTGAFLERHCTAMRRGERGGMSARCACVVVVCVE